MKLDDITCYEFGDFVLDTHRRTLTHFNRSITLPGKDFDLLAYLVKNPGLSVSEKQLIAAVWSDAPSIHPGNITNHISKIRRALNCDAAHPKFIKTLHGKHGYRFIAKVTERRKSEKDETEINDEVSEFTVESHLFSPVYLGVDSFKYISGGMRDTMWAKYREFKIDDGRLCILPGGMAVWHLVKKHWVKSFVDLAAWRHKTYEEILSGDHISREYNERLIQIINKQSKKEPLESIIGKHAYVFSLMVLDEPKRTRPAKLIGPLRLLTFLSALENTSISKNYGSRRLEHEMLDGDYSNIDVLEFGTPGMEKGFASWDGLSYLQHAGDQNIKDLIIEFEIAVQATWGLSNSIYNRILDEGPDAKAELTPLVQNVKWQFSRLRSITATESTSQRTMVEAILTTSRLERLVEDTIRLFDQL